LKCIPVILTKLEHCHYPCRFLASDSQEGSFNPASRDFKPVAGHSRPIHAATSNDPECRPTIENSVRGSAKSRCDLLHEFNASISTIFLRSGH
jgi:hypothetical protein